MDEEWNVNGSYMAIEGITSPDGRVLGKMAHSERRGESVAINIYGEQDMKIFESVSHILNNRKMREPFIFLIEGSCNIENHVITYYKFRHF